MTRLRTIALTIRELETGHFHWVLIESTEDFTVWQELASSELSFPTYFEAYDAGSSELFKLVPDERIGPQGRGEDEDADPVGHGSAPKAS